MVFQSVEVLRKAITEYKLKQRVEIKMPRNDRTRIRAHCAEGYPWNLYASFDRRTKTFMVKTYVESMNAKRNGFLKDALESGLQRCMLIHSEQMRR